MPNVERFQPPPSPYDDTHKPTHAPEEIFRLPMLEQETYPTLSPLRIFDEQTRNNLHELPIRKGFVTYTILSHRDQTEQDQTDGTTLQSAVALYNQEAATYKRAYDTADMRAGDKRLARIQDQYIAERRAKSESGRMNVLDIGCGAGDFLDRHADIGPDEYVGIDVSREMILQAYQDQPRHTFFRADAAAVTLQPESIDLAVSDYGPVSYISEIDVFYQHMFHGLKKGGLLMVMPYTDQVANGENVTEDQTPSKKVAERRFLSLEEHRRKIEAAGFEFITAIGINRKITAFYNSSIEEQERWKNRRSKEEEEQILQEYEHMMLETDEAARLRGDPPNTFRHMLLIARKPDSGTLPQKTEPQQVWPIAR